MNSQLALYVSILFLSISCTHTPPHSDVLVAIQIQDRNGLTETISVPERLALYHHLEDMASQPYKKMLRIFKKEGKSFSKITTYHPNGMIFQYLEAEEMRAKGAYREWYPNGQKKIEAHVIGGVGDVSPGAQNDWLFEGTNQVWNEEGVLIASISYENGFIEGFSHYYYSSGKLQKVAPFKKNAMHGNVLEYYENGNLKSTTCFENGLKSGESIGYFDNQSIAWQEEYNQGLLIQGTYFTQQQTFLCDVKDGRGCQAIYEENVPSLLIEIQRGMQEGFVKTLNSQGFITRSYQVKNGKKQGEELEYFLPSELETQDLHVPKLSIQWEQDTIHGMVKTWYPNGQLQSQKEYCHNQRQGSACAWYQNGSLMFIEEYENQSLWQGSYYKKNQHQAISNITNGNGTAYLYDKDGIFLKKITYVKGKPVDPED